VMAAAFSYPDDPLPGPRPLFDVLGATEIRYWRDMNWLPPEPIRINPILEEPYFFPGNAWKGTSGMPQHRYA
jgi:hypothetical protein